MLQNSDDLPPIPTFLLRGHPDCVVPDKQDDKPSHAWIEPETNKPRLTGAYKDKGATEIIGAVLVGRDTFGKSTPLGPHYSDRELKAGIRHAKKWIPMMERRGTRAKPQMHRYQARLHQEGRRYSVVKY